MKRLSVKLKPLSFRSRIILLFGLITVLLVATLTRMSYRFLKEMYLEQLSENVSALTNALGSELELKYLNLLGPGHTLTMASEFYQGVLQNFSENSQVNSAFLFDKEFRILAGSQAPNLLGFPDPALVINRMEIQNLKVGETVTTLPFKAQDGEWYLWAFYRLDGEHYLGVRESAGRLSKIDQFTRTFWLIGLAGLILVLAASFFLAHTVARPVEKLIGFSRALGEGRFDAQLPEGIKGELSTLAHSLDRMRRDIARAQIEKEHMLAQIAHEIRNPLGGMELLVGLLREDLRAAGKDTEYPDKVLQEIVRLKALITAYLSFSRPPRAKPKWVSVSEVLNALKFRFQESLNHKQIKFFADGTPLRIWFDPGHLEQILGNLIANSLEAIPERGEINISSTVENGDWCIVVSDNGPGIPEEIQERIFDPFFTTHPEGTGLGLAICKRLCEENQARLVWESQPGKGTTFRILKRAKDTTDDTD